MLEPAHLELAFFMPKPPTLLCANSLWWCVFKLL